MNWFTYALIAAVNLTIYSLLIRKFLEGRGDAKVFAMLTDITLALLLFAFAFFDNVFVDLSMMHLALIMVASALYAGSSVLFIWGRQLEEVSRVSIVRQLMIIWIFAGAVIVLGEPFSFGKLAGIGLVLAGTMVAFWEGSEFSITKGLVLVLAGSVVAAVSSLIGKTIVEDNLSPALFVGAIALLAGFWVFLFLPDRTVRAMNEIKLQTWRLGVIALFLGLAVYFVYKAYQVGEASRVGPVYGSSLLFTVLAGIVILGERDRTLQKIIGAVIAFSGVVVLRLL